MSELSSSLSQGDAGAEARAESASLRIGGSAISAALSLACADVATTQVVFAVVALAVGLGTGTADVTAAWQPVQAAAASIGLLASSWVLGVYDIAGRGPIERFRMRVLAGVAMPLAALSLLTFIEPLTSSSAIVLGATALLGIPATLASEAWIRDRLIARGAWGATALLLGPESDTAKLAAELQARPELGIRPEARMAVEAFAALHTAPPPSAGRPEHDRFTRSVEVVILLEPERLFSVARLTCRRIITLAGPAALPALWMRTLMVGDAIGFESWNRGSARASAWAKRVLDLCIAVPALLVAALPILVIALAIMAVSPGPVFYTQRRVGLRGEPIRILKLRTMYVDAEDRLRGLLHSDAELRREWERHVKLARDPRVLPVVGSFLRRLSLDELPQLWNVVCGDMSLVGPRPFPGYHISRFDADFQMLRASVKPGLSGLWQISERSDADIKRQQEIDSFYIHNWSLWLDLYVLLNTIPAMLRARGAR